MPTPGWLRRADLPLDAQGRSYIDAPSLDQILDQMVNWRGDVNASGYKLVGLTMSLPSNIEIGVGVPGNRAAWIDLVGDDTYTDYGLRIIRNAEGPNATSDIIHRGAGELRLQTIESAPVAVYMGGTRALLFNAGGITFQDGSVQASAGVPVTRQILAGTGLIGGGDLTADRTLSVVNDTTIQKVIAGANGVQAGQRAWLNLVAGSNVVLSAADDAPNNRVNITINSTGGGAGGSQTPWLTDIDAQGYGLTRLRDLKLYGYAASTHGVIHWYVDAQDRWQIGVNSTSPDMSFHRFGADGVYLNTPLTLSVSGNVGIGTASPFRLLSLVAPNRTSVETADQFSIGEGTNNPGYQLRIGYALFNSVWHGVLQTIANDIGADLVLNPLGGNVGIGTASPSATLHVHTYSAPADTVGGALVLSRYPNDSIACGGAIFNTHRSVTAQEQLAFTVSTVGGFTDLAKIRMVVQENGNVGIGTTTPSYKLHIHQTTTNVQTLYAEHTGAGNVDSAGFFSNSNNAAQVSYGVVQIYAVSEHANNVLLSAGTNLGTKFQVCADGRVRILSGGVLKTLSVDAQGFVKAA